jgi:hypothetical protein
MPFPNVYPILVSSLHPLISPSPQSAVKDIDPSGFIISLSVLVAASSPFFPFVWLQPRLLYYVDIDTSVLYVDVSSKLLDTSLAHEDSHS